MKTAVAYCRYSSDNQREESIEAQLRAIKTYCEQETIKMGKIYIDEATSGKNDNRDNFLSMFNDIKQELVEVDFVIVHKLDRFARNRYDSAFYKKKLKDKGVKLISVLERLDDTPESVILESVLEGMSEYYILNLSREVMKGMKETALQCKHTGGTPPLGYKVNDNKKYDIVEKEAEAVKMIYEMYTNGYNNTQIARELNSKGYKTKRNKNFTINSIKDLIPNEKYKGVYVFNKRISGKKHNRKYKSDDEIIRIEGGIQAIVSEELWEDANKRLKSKEQKPRNKSKQTYILTGKVKCLECGGNYTGFSHTGGRNKKKYNKYACSNRSKGCKNKPIRKELLEEYTLNTIKELILNTDTIEDLTNKLHEKINELENGKDGELQRLKKEQMVIKAKIDKILNLYLEGTIDKDIYNEKADSLNVAYTDTTEKIISLEVANYDSFNKEKIRSILFSYLEKINTSDDKIRRKIIETFVDKIEVGEEITVYLKFGVYKGGGGGPQIYLNTLTTLKQFYLIANKLIAK